MLRDEILRYLHILNEKLRQQNVKGEICLYGGAVMCLVFDARPSTKDVDAIFHPSEIIRKAAKEIANELDLADDWLNDGVKGFLVDHPKNHNPRRIIRPATQFFLEEIFNEIQNGSGRQESDAGEW